MIVIRYGIALLLAVCVAIGLFAVMNHLILDVRSPTVEFKEATIVEFVSVHPEETVIERPREQTETPPPLELAPPPTMAFATAGQPPDLPQIEIDSPRMDIDMGLSLGKMGSPAAVPARVEITRAAIAKAAFPPQYPQKAARSRIEGHVVVEFVVNSAGSVEDINVIESSPLKIFDKAAMRAISRYTFQPALKDGEPVASRARQRMDFQL